MFHTKIKEHCLILAIHVDDCVLTGSSSELIARYKEKINACYALTDLGPIHWLLGINITCDHDMWTISLLQESFIDSILACFALQDVKSYATLMVPGVIYSRSDCPTSPAETDRMSKVPYWEAIGSLMYASIATCPDITFAMSTLLQFLDNLGNIHWEAVKCVFCYLSGMKGYQLTYGGKCFDLVGYMDVDGATQEHCQAISSYAFLIDGGTISWSSRKQELVTLSTAEAEYVAAMHAAKEAIWLRRLLFELFPLLDATTTLYRDNQAAV